MGLFVGLVFIGAIFLGQFSGNYISKDARDEYKKNKIKIETRHNNKKNEKKQNVR